MDSNTDLQSRISFFESELDTLLKKYSLVIAPKMVFPYEKNPKVLELALEILQMANPKFKLSYTDLKGENNGN